VGKRDKTEDLNNKPFNSQARPEQKAREFDQQYNQNRTYTNTPQSDAAGVEKKKGRHRR